MKARFTLEIARNTRGNYYIKFKSINGRTFNHSYNTKGKAKQSADSLFKSMKTGHCVKKYS